jgi:hypothetical protein
MMPGGPQWRPNNQPLYSIQSEIAPSFGGRNFWPPGSTGQQAIPPPVPPPVPPPLPPQQSQIPSQFPAASYQHSPVDKRMMNTSFNTSIPSLMDLPSSYKQNPVPPPMPIPPVSVLPIDPIVTGHVANAGGSNTNAKRRKIPAWLREELGRIEREKEKKMHNTSNNNNNDHSTNNSSSKFDDDDDDEEEETNNRTFNDDDDNDEENEQDEDEESSSTQISSTPIVTRRSRFVGYCDWTFKKEQCVYYHLIFF